MLRSLEPATISLKRMAGALLFMLKQVAWLKDSPKDLFVSWAFSVNSEMLLLHEIVLNWCGLVAGVRCWPVVAAGRPGKAMRHQPTSRERCNSLHCSWASGQRLTRPDTLSAWWAGRVRCQNDARLGLNASPHQYGGDPLTNRCNNVAMHVSLVVLSLSATAINYATHTHAHTGVSIKSVERRTTLGSRPSANKSEQKIRKWNSKYTWLDWANHKVDWVSICLLITD